MSNELKKKLEQRLVQLSEWPDTPMSLSQEEVRSLINASNGILNDLENLITTATEKAETTCAHCGHQLYRLDEPLETLIHPMYSRLTLHMHAGFSPDNLDGYWCHGGYTTHALPMKPEIKLNDLIYLIRNHKGES